MLHSHDQYYLIFPKSHSQRFPFAVNHSKMDNPHHLRSIRSKIQSTGCPQISLKTISTNKFSLKTIIHGKTCINWYCLCFNVSVAVQHWNRERPTMLLNVYTWILRFGKYKIRKFLDFISIDFTPHQKLLLQTNHSLIVFRWKHNEQRVPYKWIIWISDKLYFFFFLLNSSHDKKCFI